MSGCGKHDRWTFGCGQCIGARESLERAHEYKTAPKRRVRFNWEVETSGTFTAVVKVPASWMADKEELTCQLGAVFDEELGSSDAMSDVLVRIGLVSFEVGDIVPEVPAADDGQGSLL